MISKYRPATRSCIGRPRVLGESCQQLLAPLGALWLWQGRVSQHCHRSHCRGGRRENLVLPRLRGSTKSQLFVQICIDSSLHLEANPETRDDYRNKTMTIANSHWALSIAQKLHFHNQPLEVGPWSSAFMKVETDSERLSNSLKVTWLAIAGDDGNPNAD